MKRNYLVNIGGAKYIVEETTTCISGTSAGKRIKRYFMAHPDQVIEIDVFCKIADGVRDWTRQLRYLREEGMDIEYIPKGHSQNEGYIYHTKTTAA